ncbi:Protein C42C1.4 a [Aphelenchoides avenae]|nr:Protein C42C1.4 a [Aphelenchus avenae]
MSSIATDDESDRWLDLDDNISVPTQSLDEILAEDLPDEDLSGFEDDDSLFFPLGRPGSFTAINASYELKCPILVAKLDAVSHQLHSIHDRPSGGLATAVSVSSEFIAVGMSRGLTLVFQRDSGKLAHYVFSDKESAPVSCLDFSHDSSKLAIGYSRGALRIFNCHRGKVIDERPEVVQPGHGLLHVKYVTSSALILVDSGGSVYELREQRSKDRRSRCVFTGCKGEVVNIGFIKSLGLLMLASLKQVLMISVRKGRLVAQIRLSGPADSPPLMTWCQRKIQVTARTHASDTRLALARGNEVRIHQVQISEHGTVVCPLIRVVRVEESPMINLKWIDDFHLLAIDAREQLLLMDTVKGVVSKTPVEELQLVYNSADFKGLSTGGNVSEALKCLSDNVCYQSVSMFGDDVYVLGPNSLHAVSVMDQAAQLDHFEEKNDLASAVLYATDVYNGSVRDRTRNGDLRHRISHRLPDLISRLLDFTLRGLPSGRVTDLADHYKRHIPILVRVCVSTSHYDLLYNTVFRRLEKDCLSRTILFDVLDEYFAEGLLDQPPPALVHDYLAHLVSEGQFSQFELAVTRVPIDRLDIHQVITTCRQNQLYDGIAYVMNNALHDFVGPLQEMIDNVATFSGKEVLSDWEVVQGNKLLLYLSCCLTGRAYPWGQLPEHLDEVVPIETYKTLIALRRQSPGPHATEQNETLAKNYPNLRVLLKYDAQQFFNVICACADAPVFANSDGRLRRLVDVILGIVDDDLEEETIIRVLAAAKRAQDAVEHSVVDLMKTLPGISTGDVLQAARRLPHTKVCTYIFTQQGRYAELLQCYLDDSAHPHSVFDALQDLLRDTSGSDYETVRSWFEKSLNTLTNVDAYRTAEIVSENLTDLLADAKSLPFDLIRSCFEMRRDKGFQTVSSDEDVDEHLFCTYFEGLILPTSDDAQRRDEHVVETLNYWLPLGSRTDFCLNLAVQHGLVESSVLLLVERQFVFRAFEMLYDSLTGCITQHDRLLKRLDMLVDLANAHRDESRQQGWLIKVFQFILAAKDVNINSELLDTRLVNVFTAIIEGGYSGGEEVISTLLSHHSFENMHCSTFTALVQKLLISCQLEETLMRNTIRCMESEYLQDITRIRLLSRHAGAPLVRSDYCIVCSERHSNRSLVLYSCGHMAHIECSDESRTCVCQAAEGSAIHAQQFPELTAPLRPSPTRKRIHVSENLELHTGPRGLGDD